MSVMESNGLIQSKLEPQISPSPGDGSSKDAHQVRVFKCLERMQKMLVDHTKFSTRDIESCIKLKKLLQDNPELSESQISRLECIIGKKVKVELDEIDLKIVEEKCALENKRIADMERSSNNKTDNTARMYKFQQEETSAMEHICNEDIAALENLSLDSDSKQLTRYNNQSNFSVNNQNYQSYSQQGQSNHPIRQQSNFLPIAGNISQTSADQSCFTSPHPHQGQLSTKPEKTLNTAQTFQVIGQYHEQSSSQGASNMVKLETPVKVQSQDIVSVTSNGPYLIIRHKADPEQTSCSTSTTQSQVGRLEVAVPKKIYTVPKQNSLNEALTSAGPVKAQLKRLVETKMCVEPVNQKTLSQLSGLQQLVTQLEVTQPTNQVPQQYHEKFQQNHERVQQPQEILPPHHKHQLSMSVMQPQETVHQQMPFKPSVQMDMDQPQKMIQNDQQHKAQQEHNPPQKASIPQHGHQQKQPQLQTTAIVDLTEDEQKTHRDSVEATSKWRRDAREALIKSMLQIEEEAYTSSQSQEIYLECFKDIFGYAKKSVAKINEKTKTQEVQVVKTKVGEDLTTLLNNEPPRVAAGVTREWKEIDSEINRLLNKLKLDDSGADVSSKNINLRPDNFEDSMNRFIHRFR